MKICFLTSYYPPFLKDFYINNPTYINLSFNELQNLLLDQYFADTGAAHHHFIKNGNQSFIIISNSEPLQKKWAQENNVSFSDGNWQFDIAQAQIKKYLPDVFFLESIFEFYGDFVTQVKPYCKIIASWISTPYSTKLPLNGIDIFFSSTPDFVIAFRDSGAKAEYVLPAFDARILSRINSKEPKTIPFSFVGGWSDVHINRKKALEELAKKTSIQIWGYGYKKSYSKRTLDYYKNFIFPENKEILKVYKKEAWGLEMYSILQKSVITFNIHEALLNGNVGNMRMFEASGVGTMILNDDGNNLSSLFEIGKEIESYKSIEEAIEKVNYYTSNPKKAIEIGLNAQQKTLSCYNYDIYTETISNHLKKALTNL